MSNDHESGKIEVNLYLWIKVTKKVCRVCLNLVSIDTQDLYPSIFMSIFVDVNDEFFPIRFFFSLFFCFCNVECFACLAHLRSHFILFTLRKHWFFIKTFSVACNEGNSIVHNFDIIVLNDSKRMTHLPFWHNADCFCYIFSYSC